MPNQLPAAGSPPDSSPWSTPAILSFYLLTIFLLSVIGLFILIGLDVKVEPVMIGILGGVFTTEAAGLAAVTGFWLASSLNANRANEKNSAVIAQLSGAGPPPPSPPLDPNPPAPAVPVTDAAPEAAQPPAAASLP